jgi:hypothetical protein
MPNGTAGYPIEEHPRRRGDEQGDNPIPETAWEPPSLQKVNDVVPTHGVESLSDVKLEEECRSLASMKSSGEVLDIEEIVVDTPLLDEGTLGLGH